MWDIKMNYAQYSCINSLIAAYCESIHRDHQMLFSMLLNGRYQPHKQLVGDRFAINDYLPPEGLHSLAAFSGIELQMTHADDEQQLKQLLTERLQAAPVLFSGDVFNIPWNSIYRQEHMLHVLLFTGYDEESDLISCVDALSTDIYHTISLRQLVEYPQYLMLFFTGPLPQPTPEQYLCALQRNVDTLVQSKFLEERDRWFADIRALTDFEPETAGYQNLYGVPLLYMLKRIDMQQISYCDFLQYIGQKTGLDLSAVLESFYQMNKRFLNLRLYLAKEIVSKKVAPAGRAALLDEISRLQRSIVSGLQALTKTGERS